MNRRDLLKFGLMYPLFPVFPSINKCSYVKGIYDIEFEPVTSTLNSPFNQPPTRTSINILELYNNPHANKTIFYSQAKYNPYKIIYDEFISYDNTYNLLNQFQKGIFPLESISMNNYKQKTYIDKNQDEWILETTVEEILEFEGNIKFSGIVTRDATWI